MSLGSILASPPVRTTQVSDALIVWVASTTVGAERKRMSHQLAKARGVFGTYAESSQPRLQRLMRDLRDLAGQPDSATLIPAPHEFGATHASKLLPRGARVVGWLDPQGYRGVTDTPQPCPEWLRERRSQLR